MTSNVVNIHNPQSFDEFFCHRTNHISTKNNSYDVSE